MLVLHSTCGKFPLIRKLFKVTPFFMRTRPKPGGRLRRNAPWKFPPWKFPYLNRWNANVTGHMMGEIYYPRHLLRFMVA